MEHKTKMKKRTKKMKKTAGHKIELNGEYDQANPDNLAEELHCGNLEMNLDVLLFVDLHPVN